MDVVMGVAPRQHREPSGLCVVEIDSRRGEDGKKEAHYLVRHLERLRPGTSFPDMAKRSGGVAAAIHKQTGSRPEIFVDATGFGGELVTLIERNGDYREAQTVFFTHGDRRVEDRKEVRLGKGWLVTRVKLLLQTHQLHLPRSPEAETLAAELVDFEVKPQPDNDLYGAYKVGTHDELVTALGLAVQRPPRPGMEYAKLRFW